MRQDPGRAPQARDPGRSEHDPADPPPSRPRARTTAHRTDLERVPPSAGRGSARVRLLHGGDGAPEDVLRPVLYRALHETGARGRHHEPTRLSLDYPAGPEPLDHAGARGQAHPAPGSRRQVLWSVRRGLPDRGSQRREDTRSGTEGPSRSVGSAPFVGSASTTSSSSEGVTWNASSPHTPSTTTGPGHTGASIFDRLTPLPLWKEQLARESDGERSSAGSYMSTGSARHDSYQSSGARQGWPGRAPRAP